MSPSSLDELGRTLGENFGVVAAGGAEVDATATLALLAAAVELDAAELDGAELDGAVLAGAAVVAAAVVLLLAVVPVLGA